MGLFGRSKKNKERKEALVSLKHLERTQKSYKMTSTADPSKALNELQPCTKSPSLSLGIGAVFGGFHEKPSRKSARSEREPERIRDPCIRLIKVCSPGQVNQEKSRNALSAYEYKDIYGRPIGTIASRSFVRNETDVRLQRNPISRIPREADGNDRWTPFEPSMIRSIEATEDRRMKVGGLRHLQEDRNC
jgi:hypothetical protein